MATARITSGFGVAPGFGTVGRPARRPTAWAGGLGSSIQTGFQNGMTRFTPQTPARPAASAPAAASPDPTALPVDPLYDSQIGQFTRTRDDTIASDEQQRRSGLLGYGYSATYDDKGNVASLAYDPNNPYSQAALARTVYQQSKTGTNNSMAARGQLYSGALINAQNQNDTNFNVGENSRQTALTNFLNGLNANDVAAKNAFGSDSLQAQGDRISRAPDNRNYSPTSAPDAAPAAPASSSTADLIRQWAAQQYTVQPGTNSRGQRGVWHTYSDGRPRQFIVGAVR